jgi:hypothetical protein
LMFFFRLSRYELCLYRNSRIDSRSYEWSSTLAAVHTSICNGSSDTVPPSSLSIWATKSDSNPIMDTRHEIHCAKKICCVLRAYPSTLSREWTITSFKLWKVTGISILGTG